MFQSTTKGSEEIMENCCYDFWSFIGKSISYFFSGICWLVFFVFQLSIWFITYAGPIYLIILSLNTSQKIHDSDPVIWEIKTCLNSEYCRDGTNYDRYDRKTTYDVRYDKRSTYNVKESYDTLFMMTLISCAFVISLIFVNGLMWLTKKLKKTNSTDYVVGVLFVLNWILYVCHVAYTWIIYMWSITWYANRKMDGKSQVFVENNIPTDDIQYYWNMVCIGWLIYNIFVTIFGIPMKYAVCVIMLKQNENCCRYISRNDFGELDEEYSYGTIYSIKYCGLNWIFDRLPTINCPDCYDKCVYGIIYIFKKVLLFSWIVIQFMLVPCVYIGPFLICVLTFNLNNKIKESGDEEWYTTGVLNSKSLYVENNETKILTSYDVKEAYDVIIPMTIASVSCVYVLILSHIITIVSLHANRTRCTVITTIISRWCGYITYGLHSLSVWIVYVWTIAYYYDRNMSGQNGFYLKDKTTPISNETQDQLELYWNVVCIGWLFCNLIITIFGIPIKYPITIIYNFSSFVVNDNEDLYDKESFENTIFSVYNTESIGIFMILSQLCNKKKDQNTKVQTFHTEQKPCHAIYGRGQNIHVVVEIERENETIDCVICDDMSAKYKSNIDNKCSHIVYCQNCFKEFRKKVLSKEMEDQCPLCRSTAQE